MGWTTYRLPTGRTRQEECDKMMTWSGDNNGGRKLLKSAMVGSVYYAAIEHTLPDGTRNVWAAIFLTSMSGGTFGYKDMDESCGPYEAKCPVGILDLLTPTESEWANKWRANCRAYHASKSTNGKPKVTPGARVRFDAPIKFTDGYTSDTFTFAEIVRRGRKAKVFQAGTGLYYRISGWQRRVFTVLGNA